MTPLAGHRRRRDARPRPASTSWRAAGDVTVTAADPRRARHHRPGGGRRAPSPGTTSCVNAAAWTDVDGAEAARGRRDRGQRRRGRASWPQACAAHRRPAAARLHRLRLRRRRRPTPYPEDAPTAPGQRVRPQQARRRAGRARAAARARLRRAHRLALRRARPQLRRHHAAAGRRAARPSTSSTTSAASRPGRCALAAQLVALGRRGAGRQAPAGVYHGTASGQTTWMGLAREQSPS